MISFAGTKPNNRAAEVFIAADDRNRFGREPWERPFGKVRELSMRRVVRKFHSYGESPPFGAGIDATGLFLRGNEMLRGNCLESVRF